MSRSGVTCDVWCVVQICCRKFSSAVKCWIQTRVPKYEDNDDVERRRNSFGADTGTFVACRSSFFPCLWGFSDFFLLQNWGGVFQWEAPLNFVKPPSVLEKNPQFWKTTPSGTDALNFGPFWGEFNSSPFPYWVDWEVFILSPTDIKWKGNISEMFWCG